MTTLTALLAKIIGAIYDVTFGALARHADKMAGVQHEPRAAAGRARGPLAPCDCGEAEAQLDYGPTCAGCKREESGLGRYECALCGAGVSAFFWTCRACKGNPMTAQTLAFAQLVQAGICTKCKDRPARADKYLCGRCSDPQLADEADECQRLIDQWAERRAERKAAGQCLICGERPAVAERDICGGCAELDQTDMYAEIDAERAADTAERKAEREALKAAGICTECGERPAVKGRVRCAECTELMRARRVEREAEPAGRPDV